MKKSKKLFRTALITIFATLLMAQLFVAYADPDPHITYVSGSIKKISNPSDNYTITGYVHSNYGYTVSDCYFHYIGNKHFHMSLGMSYKHKNETSSTTIWKNCRTTGSTGTNEMEIYHTCTSSCSNIIQEIIGRFSVNDCYRELSGHTGDTLIQYTFWLDDYTLTNPNP